MMWNVLIDRKEVNRIQTELLLRKAQSGDTGALDTLIAAYYPQILNYCRWHTADEQQAQDAAQETFSIPTRKGAQYGIYQRRLYLRRTVSRPQGQYQH